MYCLFFFFSVFESRLLARSLHLRVSHPSWRRAAWRLRYMYRSVYGGFGEAKNVWRCFFSTHIETSVGCS
jgi:hypothetical protein